MNFKYPNIDCCLIKKNEKENNHKIFKIDYCENLCLCFIGDYKNDIHCKICKNERFTKCNKDKCKTKSYENCNHSYLYRTAKKCAYYIPSFIYYFIFINIIKYMNK